MMILFVLIITIDFVRCFLTLPRSFHLSSSMLNMASTLPSEAERELQKWYLLRENKRPEIYGSLPIKVHLFNSFVMFS